MQINEKPVGKGSDSYLIIGGAPKSGTTSLFRYLSDHPQICPANFKETYFFAREFDLKGVCKEEETLEAFEKYFTHCHSPHSLRVEATPYTLYSRDAATKIADLLPNATMLFILRDPVERFISNYKFRMQRGYPSIQETLEEFIERQLKVNSNLPNILQLGHYVEYLRPFFHTFNPHKILVTFFEEFKTNPAFEMQRLCLALGINENFYSNYHFVAYNQTVNVRYNRLNRVGMRLEPIIANMRASVIGIPILLQTFEKVISAGKLLYRTINHRDTKISMPISAEAKAYLAKYYRAYNQALSKELGRSIPWISFEPI